MPPKRKSRKYSSSEDSSDEEGSNYDGYTVAQLKTMLKKRGLETVGRKADLIKLLVEDDGEDGAEKVPYKKPAAPVKSSKKKGKKKAESESDSESSSSSSSDDEPKKKKRRITKDSDNDDSKRPSRGKEKAEKTEEAEAAGKWKREGGLIYRDIPVDASDTIIGFDMDDTLIETESGKTFAKSRTDWKFLYPEVKTKLKALHDEKKKLVIFTNQGGINGKNGYDQSKAKMITGKIDDIIKELGIPVQVFIATSEDSYRKPSTDMWDEMVKSHNGGVVPDLAKCAYVGDAAGRDDGWAEGKKKDFACTDRKFAKNCGIGFFTPEEFFLDEKPVEFDWRGVDLDKVAAAVGTDVIEGGTSHLTSDTQEVILFVGFPASGKSTFAETHLIPKGYVHINRDTLKTQDKCVKLASEAIDEGKKVVIDNTNGDKSNRADFISLAKKAKIPIRCFRFTADIHLATHLNYLRERMNIRKHVSKIAYNMYKSKFTEPDVSEGFSEVRKVYFVPDFKGDAAMEKSFKMLAEFK